MIVLTSSWRRLLSYRNQSIDLPSKSMDWFLYDNGLRHEKVNKYSSEKENHKEIWETTVIVWTKGRMSVKSVSDTYCSQRKYLQFLLHDCTLHVHSKATHTQTNLQLSVFGLFKYAWLFSGHQALKGFKK